MAKKSAANNTKRRKVHAGKRMLWRQLGVGFIVVTLVGLLVAGVWHGSRAASMQIDNVSVSGNDTVSTALVEEVVWTELSGTYFALVPRQFQLTYPQAAIVSAVAALPKIESVHVHDEASGELMIEIEEYQPTALWCDEVEGGRSCVYVSVDGYAYLKAPALEGNAFLRFNDEKKDVAVSTQFMPPSRFTTLLLLTEELKERLGFVVEEVIVHDEDDADLVLSTGALLKITSSQSVEEIAVNLETLLSAPEFQVLERGEFEYIDLRFGDKVFVLEEPPVELATTTATSTEDSELVEEEL